MKRIILKVILSFIFCSMAVVLALGGLSTINSEKVFKGEMEEKLLYATAKYANEFNLLLQRQEITVNTLTATAEELFGDSGISADRARFDAAFCEMERILQESLLQVNGLLGLFITFNPQFSHGQDEIWYIRTKEGQTRRFDDAGTTDIWLMEGGPYSEYYFSAIENGHSWSNVYHDRLMDLDCITYAKAVYDPAGQLIGVIGTDLLVEDILNTVNNMKVYEDGFACLLNDQHKHIAGGEDEHLRPAIESEILQQAEQSGLLHCMLDGGRHLVSYAHLTNNWHLLLVQPEKAALAPIKYERTRILLLSILLLTLVVCYSIYFSRKSVMPIVDESVKKDIIIINQARQAALGEMAGNISHQCKQPLNSMNIWLSIMEDDFRNGELDSETMKEHMERLRLGICTMSETVDDFADFLIPGRKKDNFNARDEIQKALNLMRERLSVHSITVHTNLEKESTVYGFRNEFSQVVFNVLDNARDAIIESDPPQRLITITMEVEREPLDQLRIDIVNNGKPIPESIFDQIFDPYFTTKEKQGGLGMGLYLTRRIVEEHMNGQIFFLNGDDTVCCRILIPRGGKV